ncbi:MAG TPA: TIGR03086 family protein [Intrasporangiaceae bacterium]|nr:TIGR03086 family protein [Intrasporangiaceae bacterium]
MSQLTEATAAERHRILADQFLTLADGVADWEAPTPVKEWRAADIVEHMAWLPGMLQSMGATLDVPPTDSPLDHLRAQTAAVQHLLDGPDGDREIDTNMMGVMPLRQVIDQFYNFDLYAHAWDLAKASGQRIELDADYATAAHAGLSAMGPALHESGQFGSPQPVADDASPQDRLIAYIGRDPSWAPAAS